MLLDDTHHPRQVGVKRPVVAWKVASRNYVPQQIHACIFLLLCNQTKAGPLIMVIDPLVSRNIRRTQHFQLRYLIIDASFHNDLSQNVSSLCNVGVGDNIEKYYRQPINRHFSNYR